MKTTLTLLVGLSLSLLLLTGCHHDNGTDFSHLTRAEQEKALHGDPAKGAQVIAQMRARGELGGPPAPPASH